jgi:hypothetical protein
MEAGVSRLLRRPSFSGVPLTLRPLQQLRQLGDAVRNLSRLILSHEICGTSRTPEYRSDRLLLCLSHPQKSAKCPATMNCWRMAHASASTARPRFFLQAKGAFTRIHAGAATTCIDVRGQGLVLPAIWRTLVRGISTTVYPDVTAIRRAENHQARKHPHNHAADHDADLFLRKRTASNEAAICGLVASNTEPQFLMQSRWIRMDVRYKQLVEVGAPRRT